MFTRTMDKLKTIERGFLFFLIANVFMGFAQSIDGSVLSNFLKEKLNFEVMQRTMLEIPRELPGFLVILITGLLCRLGDIRMAVVANILAAIGMMALGIIQPEYSYILFFMFIYSTGMHLFIPLSSSISMSFASHGDLGRKLGQIGAANTAAMLAGSIILYILFRFVQISYTVSFVIGGAAFLVSSAMFLFIKQEQTCKIKSRFVFRKEYRVFYILSALYGARKQIFLTFGPWVLVDAFNQKVTSMTLLFFVSAALSIFVKPLIGTLIDKKGERFVLALDAAGLFVICLGYAFAKDLLPLSGALIVIIVCYVLDSSFLATNMARSTYIRKIAVRNEDVLPVLSSGISIDHIFSMLLPFLGGMLWISNGTYGYKYVFLAGAVVALANLAVTRFIVIRDNITDERNLANGEDITSDDAIMQGDGPEQGAGLIADSAQNKSRSSE